MERIPKDKLLHFNPNALVQVRKDAGFDNPEDLNRAIDLLDDWVKKQEHFVKKDFSRGYLERGLILTKGSLENAKMRLDKICTIRTIMPEFFEDYNFEKEFNLPKTFHLVLPKQTKENDRVYWLRCDIDSITSSIIHNLNRLGVVKGHGGRLKSLNILTSSKLIDGVVNMVKSMLSPKLRQRIHVHKDIQSLYEFVPREVIPVEYGGDEEKSLEEINAEWVKELSSENFKEEWREMCRARTDESRRPAGAFNEEYMGMQGSFRTLTVD